MKKGGERDGERNRDRVKETDWVKETETEIVRQSKR